MAWPIPGARCDVHRSLAGDRTFANEYSATFEGWLVGGTGGCDAILDG